MSSWFRDYVYIPLGGNRKHQYLNILIVFILSGIWHGNTLNFVLWGSLHGLGQIINRIYHNYISKKLNIRNKLIKIITNSISIAITFIAEYSSLFSIFTLPLLHIKYFSTVFIRL